MTPISLDQLDRVLGGMSLPPPPDEARSSPRYETQPGNGAGITTMNPGRDPAPVDSGPGFRRNPAIADPAVQDVLRTMPRDL